MYPPDADLAYKDCMFTGVIPMPKWMWRNIWYDFYDTCVMLQRDYRSPESMDWWIDEYLVEPEFNLRPDDYFKQQVKSFLLQAVNKPPKKPLVTRYLPRIYSMKAPVKAAPIITSSVRTPWSFFHPYPALRRHTP